MADDTHPAYEDLPAPSPLVDGAPEAQQGPNSSGSAVNAAVNATANGPAPGLPPPPSQDALSSPAVDRVLHSDIGVGTLLNRLKQSIASARDFATFLKKRSVLEEEQAQGLKKLCRAAHENVRRPDSRQGSYAQQLDEVMRIHERMTEHGMTFALSLHQMHEELLELTANAERGRKHWKQVGLLAEKRVQDAELAMDKAKSKYDALAEDYDRARTGDRQAGKKFGLKGPKSAAQLEEDTHRKAQAADADYAAKVNNAQALRQELVTSLRPQALRTLQDLILECDSALTMQLQKFATFNERLLLNNGLTISPLSSTASQGPQPKSLREVVHLIDNERDLGNDIMSHSSSVPTRVHSNSYKPNPGLSSQKSAAPPAGKQAPGPPSISVQHGRQMSQAALPPDAEKGASPPGHRPSDAASNGQGPPPQYGAVASAGPPQIPPQFPHAAPGPSPVPTPQPQPGLGPVHRTGSPSVSDAPSGPVFGASLDELFRKHRSAVPMIVYQCIQAVDLFGLQTEGIYRNNGSSSNIKRLKALFDSGAMTVDFRDPEQFFHDIDAVAGVMRLFFRELPRPLLFTPEGKTEGFIDYARIEDDTIRRDKMHEAVNDLPDPNYATLRALTLHLQRVQEHMSFNRMDASALGTVFGPTLMGSNVEANLADAAWQGRAVQTILDNTFQIFDGD
ncbi:MAG: hypothetical protein M1832_006384 [Thelocarpon impressellum]|nr:MAG: hypothetical protein M1832_006384 [Thelocarpon impressellum]